MSMSAAPLSVYTVIYFFLWIDQKSGVEEHEKFEAKLWYDSKLSSADYSIKAFLL